MQSIKGQFGNSFPDKAQKRGLNIPAIREKLRIMCTFIPVITKLAAISTELGNKIFETINRTK
jgi:hypothetical protein